MNRPTSPPTPQRAQQPKTQNGEATAIRPSRFVYHTEMDEEDGDPGEGGVHAVVEDIGGDPANRFVPSGRTGEPSPEDLLLDISELARTTGMRYKHTFALAPRVVEFAEIVSPQSGTLSLTNTGAVLLIQGTVQADLSLECGRCLETTIQSVDAEILEDFELVAKRNAFNQEEVEAVDEDTPAAVIRGNILNLGELVRQSLLLAAPPQPLCRAECPGVLVNGKPLIAQGDGNNGGNDDAVRRQTDAVVNPLRGLGALIQQKYGDVNVAEDDEEITRSNDGK